MIPTAFKLIRPALLVLLLVPPIPAHADGVSPSSPPASAGKSVVLNSTAKTTKDSMMTVKTPGNVLELMENLRDAIRNRLLLDETFYTEENVKKITAGQQINVIRHQKKPVLEAEAFDFRAIADNLEAYGGGLSIDIALETRPDGKKSVVIRGNISSDQPRLHYLVIEKMVGYAWQARKPEPWGSNRLYQEPSDPYGNVEREYSHQDGGIEEKGSFTFNPAGHLNGFTLRSEEK